MTVHDILIGVFFAGCLTIISGMSIIAMSQVNTERNNARMAARRSLLGLLRKLKIEAARNIEYWGPGKP